MTALRHGPQLDEAIARDAGGALATKHSICEDALDTRITQLIDHQFETMLSEQGVADAAAILSEHGSDPDLATLLQMRSAIGGAFRHGLAVGLELAHIEPVEIGAADA